MIRRLLLLAALLCAPALAPLPALAQQAIVVSTCGGLTFDAGPLRPLTQDTTGTLCTAGGPGGTTSTVTQASTTSGQSGTLVQGAVTTSAPTYVTAKTNPLSLTTAGALRTDRSSVAGTATSVNAGTADAGSQRVVLAANPEATSIAAPPAQMVGGYDPVAGTSRVIRISPFDLGAIVVRPALPYPVNMNGLSASVPLTAHSGNVANASAAATLTGTASTTVYITGFQCTMGGATAAAEVDVTVAGTLGGTMTYTNGAPLGAGVPPSILAVTFNPPVPASATNTAVVVTQPAGGTGNAHAACNAQGYYY